MKDMRASPAPASPSPEASLASFRAGLLFLAFFLLWLVSGCSKDPAIVFDQETRDRIVSPAAFLRQLDERYTSYEYVFGCKAGFDVDAYHSQNPDQEHFPNSVRFYETSCVASREIMMLKGEVQRNALPAFTEYMEQWEKGHKPLPNEANMQYITSLTQGEREKKGHIFQSVKNYCLARGGAMASSPAIGEKDKASFFLPSVAHCETSGPDDSFLFIYNPNVLNNPYGYLPQVLPRHSLTPYHQKIKDKGLYYGHGTVTMITASPECMRQYPVEYDESTGELTFGWDGYFFFIHPEHPKGPSDDKVVYFDRFRKNWVSTKQEHPDVSGQPEQFNPAARE